MVSSRSPYMSAVRAQRVCLIVNKHETASHPVVSDVLTRLRAKVPRVNNLREWGSSQ
jgi:hypothetical protein